MATVKYSLAFVVGCVVTGCMLSEWLLRKVLLLCGVGMSLLAAELSRKVIHVCQLTRLLDVALT
jgi:hypothetical protein